MQIIKEIYLDFYQTEPVLVTAKQGDNARFVKATLLDHGNLFPVPDGTTANLARDEVWNACIVNTDGTVLAPITPDMQPGRLPAEIELYLGTEKLSTWNFILVIQPSARNDSAIEGTNEYTQLDILVNQAREEISNAQTATESANAAALNANESAALANTAASNANVAASSAETNADLAMKAAISALDGKEAATSAATSANAAADRANEAAGNIEQANIKPLAYSVSGESITAGNSAEKPLIGLTVHGRADQVSTTGAQLIDFEHAPTRSCVLVDASTGTYRCNMDNTSYSFLDLPESVFGKILSGKGKTLRFQCDASKPNTLISIVIYGTREDGLDYQDAAGTPGSNYVEMVVSDQFTSVTRAVLRFNQTQGATTTDTTTIYSGLMLYFKESAVLSFELYTGNAPSPSVEYPQAIDIAGLGWATGAQLWDMGDVSGTQSAKVDVSVPIPPGTYTLSADVISSDTDADTCLIYDYTNNIAIGNMARGQEKSKTFTTDKEIRSFVFYASVSNNGSAGDTFSFKNIMLNAGSSALPWEPYTGGKPGYYDKGIEVDVTGKNLFSLDNDTVFAKEICDIVKKTNEIALTATSSSDTLFCQYVCYLSEEVTKYFCGKTITVSAKHKTNNSSLSPVIFINLYNSDNKTIADEKSIYFKRGSSVTVIVPKETVKIRFAFRVDQLRGQVVGDYVRIYDIQAEEGSTATSYEPYKTPQSIHLSTPNGLAGLKVSSGGSYTDESGQQWICDEIVRNERGTGKLIQRIGRSKVSDNLLAPVTLSNGNIALSISEISGVSSSNQEALFTMAPVLDASDPDRFETGNAYSDGTGFVIVGTPDDTLVSLAIKYGNCEFLYVLETPVETNLSAEEIAALSALHTYSPTTTISNDAGCEMTAAYVTKYYQGVGDAMFYGVADNLTTEASGTSVLDAHQGKVLDNKIGALNDLETTAKSSAVAAINEVKSETVSLIPTVLFDSPTRVGSGTFTESIYNFERIRIYYKIRYEYGSVDIYTSFISADGVVDLIGFFDFNNYLGAHLHRINLTDTTFSTVYAYQYFPPSTEKTDVGGDDAIAIYRVEGYKS
mgnify:CR=1 FL=1